MTLSILLAEDNPVIHGIMADLLRSEGHHVEVARNGVEAVEKLHAATNYDLFLLDLYLPRLSGLEVLKELRKLDRYHATPVLMLSGDHSDESRQECLAAGASDYLLKPLPPVTLLDLVAQYDRAENSPPGHPTHGDAVLIDDGVIQDLAIALASEKKLQRIVHNFICTTRSQLHELQQDDVCQDQQRLRAILHSMKGAAGMFGAELLMLQCRKLEDMALPQLTAALPQLAELVEKTIQRLEQRMQQHII